MSSSSKLRVLAIEDEASVANLLVSTLSFEGFEVDVASDATTGLEALSAAAWDLILLDLRLPDGNGFEICRDLRERGVWTPLIILTARSETIDKVRGLDVGADDYVTKPFSPHELVARIRAVLRRAAGGAAQDVYRVGDLTIDLKRRQTRDNQGEIPLTKTEFELLRELVAREGEAVSRDQLLDRVWQEVFVNPRTVDAHIGSLRRKLERESAGPRYIHSVRGIGYRLEPRKIDS